jgi:colanic acid biosynthesis glycosyl transferase WcaI
MYRHYCPDTGPYAPILHSILEHAASGGQEPHVFTAQPGYNDRRQQPAAWRERLDGVEIRRIKLLAERKQWRTLRAVNFIYFLARAVIHALTHRYDLVIAGSHPPVLMGCALRMIKMLTGTPYVYHCLDVHPEAAALVGDVRQTWLQRFLRRLDTSTCRHAERVVVPSHDMATALAARGLSLQNVVVIHHPATTFGRSANDEWLVSSDTEPAVSSILGARCRSTPGTPFPDRNVTRFLFAGNLGRFQGLEQIVEAARMLATKGQVQVIFMGDGAVKQRLIELAGDLAGGQIQFLPHQSAEAAFDAMRECDYGIVSLQPDVYRYAYPSKTAAYLAAGCPLLAVVEPESELARMIRRHDMGYVAASHAAVDIASALALAACERDLWSPARRLGIARLANDTFGESRMLAAWEPLLHVRPKEEPLRAAA